MAEQAQPAKTARPAGQRTIALVKGEQRWRFHFAPGDESVLIEELGALAENPGHPLDWFDVAVISHQVTHPVVDESSSASGTKPGGAPGPAADAA